MPRTGERGGPQTRARILQAANQLFYERGFDPVTVAEVAKEAGVSSVTVFNHFPRKEELFFDRADEAIELLRSAIREPGAELDALGALRELTLRLLDERHPLSGTDPRSVQYLRTVAGAPALVAGARAIVATLQRTLADELESNPVFDGDAGLFAALFIGGYSEIFVATARRLLAGEHPDKLPGDTRARFERLFETLRNGL
jgi:AcrR family transcriptional regulator